MSSNYLTSRDTLSKLGHFDMEKLVAAILRAMGFKTRLTDRGPDKGRNSTKVYESKKVKPAPEQLIEGIKDHIGSHIWDMIQLQLCTAMRPKEVRMFKPCFILNRDKAIWEYKPEHHKLEHHDTGIERRVFLGPKAAGLKLTIK